MTVYERFLLDLPGVEQTEVSRTTDGLPYVTIYATERMQRVTVTYLPRRSRFRITAVLGPEEVRWDYMEPRLVREKIEALRKEE